MSIIGDKIHRIRDFRGMTQKQLGMAVGFDEKSAPKQICYNAVKLLSRR